MSKKLRVLLAVVMIPLLVLGSVLPGIAATVAPEHVSGNDPSNIQDLFQFKIKGNGSFDGNRNGYSVESLGSGSYKYTKGNIEVIVTINNSDSTISWESNVAMSYVFMKGGPNGNLYNYTGLSLTSDSGLVTPTNDRNGKPYGISHITFYFADPNPSISLVKEVDKEEAYPGDELQYTFTVTNTGNTVLTKVKIIDDMLGNLNDFNIGTLQPGEQQIVTVSHTISPEILQEALVNYAKVNGFFGKQKVTDSDSATVLILQPEPGSITVNKTQQIKNITLPQPLVTFNLYDSEENLIDSQRTNLRGTLTFTNLPQGTYYIEEVVPFGYYTEHDFSAEIQVVSGENTVVNVLNKLTGAITIKKTIHDEEGPAQRDVTFNLYNENQELIASQTTNHFGLAKFLNLVPGTYYVEEVVPAGYTSIYEELQVVEVQSGQINFINVVNQELPGSIEVVKTIGSVEGAPQAGVTFNLFKEGFELIYASLETNEEGIALFDNLTPGTYYLEEVVPEGYTTEHDFSAAIEIGLDEHVVVNVVNQELPGSITVVKTIDTEDGAPQAGVTFNLYQEGSEDIYASEVTNEEGIALFDNLTPGTYYLDEVVPEGYTTEHDFSVAIEIGLDEHVVIHVVNIEEEIIDVPEEPIPGGPVIVIPGDDEDEKEEEKKEDEIIEIEDEETPLGGIELPKTGESHPYLYYLLGALVVGAGFLLNRRTRIKVRA